MRVFGALVIVVGLAMWLGSITSMPAYADHDESTTDTTDMTTVGKQPTTTEAEDITTTTEAITTTTTTAASTTTSTEATTDMTAITEAAATTSTTEAEVPAEVRVSSTVWEPTILLDDEVKEEALPETGGNYLLAVVGLVLIFGGAVAVIQEEARK